MGWITEKTLSNGKVAYLATTRTPERKKVSKQCATKRDARAWMATQEGSMVTGEWLNPEAGKITFDEIAEHWIATRVGVKANTAERDEGLIRRHLLPVFGDREIASIQRSDAQVLIATLSKKYSASSVRKIIGLLKTLMDEQVAAGRLKGHGIAKLKLPPIEKRERRALTKDEVKKLAEAIGEDFAPLVYVLAYGGLRIGEAAALRHADIDRSTGAVRVQATLYEVRGVLVEHQPKTAASKRVVVLPAAVVSMLPEGDADEYVFKSPAGGPLRAKQFLARQFKPAAKQAGLMPLTQHDLRGTHATMLYELGATPPEVMARLGHSDSRMSLEWYASVSEAAEDRTVALLEAHLNG